MFLTSPLPDHGPRPGSGKTGWKMSRKRAREDEDVHPQARSLISSARRLIQDSHMHLQQLAEDRKYFIPSGFVAGLKLKISEISEMIEKIVDIESSGEKFSSLLQQLMDINEELHSTTSAFISDDRTVSPKDIPDKERRKVSYDILHSTTSAFFSNDRTVSPKELFPDDERRNVSYEIYRNFEEMVSISDEEFVLQFGQRQEPSSSRGFTADSVREFFGNISNGSVRVLGYSEFAYSSYGAQKGDDQFVEREYWVSVRNDPVKVIVHVHYAGKWSQFQNMRDRSVITAINLRHAVPRTNPKKVKVFPVLCKAFKEWREKDKFKIKVEPPWIWEQDPSRFPQLHALLRQAEACTRRVRSLSSNGPVPMPSVIGARHALILAVDEYAEPVPRLHNAIRDANNLEQALVDLGWEVRAPAPARRNENRMSKPNQNRMSNQNQNRTTK